MKKIIQLNVAILCLLCGFGVSPKISLAVVPPPAYIETHQTRPTLVATTSQNTVEASTTVPVPPRYVPQEIPANQGVVTEDFVVTSVVVTEIKTNVQTNAPTAKVIEFQGRAKPNTYVTLYIYSTPIVVTVKTDSQGNWTYNLDQELADGVHQVYVAQIDNTGNVVAKSGPIFFTKTAASVQLVSSEAVPIQAQQVNFFQQYFITIAFIILLVAIVISLTVIGLVKRKPVEVPTEPTEPTQPTDNIQ